MTVEKKQIKDEEFLKQLGRQLSNTEIPLPERVLAAKQLGDMAAKALSSVQGTPNRGKTSNS